MRRPPLEVTKLISRRNRVQHVLFSPRGALVLDRKKLLPQFKSQSFSAVFARRAIIKVYPVAASQEIAFRRRTKYILCPVAYTNRRKNVHLLLGAGGPVLINPTWRSLSSLPLPLWSLSSKCSFLLANFPSAAASPLARTMACP